MLRLAQNAALSVYEFCRSPKYLGRIFQIGIKDAMKTMQTFYPTSGTPLAKSSLGETQVSCTNEIHICCFFILQL